MVAISSHAYGQALYGVDVKMRFAKAFGAYRALLPPDFAKIPWVGQLKGVSAPVKTVATADGPALLIWVCKPHDCGNNQVSVLTTLDGKRASALLQSQDLTAGEKRIFGTPTPDERDLLEKAGG